MRQVIVTASLIAATCSSISMVIGQCKQDCKQVDPGSAEKAKDGWKRGYAKRLVTGDFLVKYWSGKHCEECRAGQTGWCDDPPGGTCIESDPVVKVKYKQSAKFPLEHIDYLCTNDNLKAGGPWNEADFDPTKALFAAWSTEKNQHYCFKMSN